MQHGRSFISFPALFAVLVCVSLPHPIRAAARPYSPSPPAGLGLAADTWSEFAPPARARHVAIFDTRHGRMVVFGSGEQSNDVWVFDPHPRPRWNRVIPAGVPPSPRAGAAAVFDAARSRMLIIGGAIPSSLVSEDLTNEVWELSLEGHFRWRKLAPLGVPPQARSFHSATIDPEHHRVLVFGGVGWSYHEFNDVWQLSLSDPPTWTQLSPTGILPGPRAAHSAIYSPELGGIVVFGGACSLCGDYPCSVCWQRNDAWLLTTRGASAWTDLTSRIHGDPPCGIKGHAAIYDPGTAAMWILGGTAFLGSSGRPASDSLWSLSLETLTWRSIRLDAPVPSQRAFLSAVFDPASERVLIYGGSDGVLTEGAAYEGPLADTWALDLRHGPSWTPLAPGTSAPSCSRLNGQDAIYDARHDQLVVYQGDEAWTHSMKDEGTWMRLATAGTPPPAHWHHVLIYDSRRDRLVAYGGQSVYNPYRSPPPVPYLTETWSLSLDETPTWSRVPTRNDGPPRNDAAAIYDPVGDRMVLVGGRDSTGTHGDVWGLTFGDAPQWAQIARDTLRSIGPGPNVYSAAIYDSRRNELVDYGGGFQYGDGWATTGPWALPLAGTPVWRPASVIATQFPPRRTLAGAVYDPRADRMVMVGGYEPGPFSEGPYGDSWALDLTNGLWSQLAPGGEAPPIWFAPLAVRDSKRDRMIVMEGDRMWTLAFAAGRKEHRLVNSLALDATETPRTPAFGFAGIHPNPSTAEFRVEYSLPDQAPTSFELMDLAGRRVWSLAAGTPGPGRHSIRIAGDTGLRPGIYLLRLRHGPASVTAKVVRVE